ncbi:Homeodomain-like protein [Tricharina praecox]|uniref:Homeodomain-like protein n=1 Tax=Tricharina praecox TaxID=43433 RepID=UPI00221E96C2|nr:Homeodomain-like protein [Tricharina praecox]KAI5852349.1 Homeodomain-like protein [Tricharina praecox]
MADEPLLPEDGASISLETPLFNVAEKDEPLIHKAVTKRSQEAPSVRPSAEEYGLFVSSAWRLCQSNPREWLRQEQRNMSMYRTGAGVHKSSSMKTMSPIRKAMSVPRPRPNPAGTPQRQIQRPARAPKATPKLAALDGFERQLYTPPRSSADGTPAPTRQRLTAPTREDSNFEALPDLTPPLESLPPHNRSLQMDWRGNPLSIEHEPHFEKLHPAEAKLASTLRLTPAIYLSSKRRIFIEKVRRTQIGKEFRKTDSQKACKIDVNKASKLWTAFDKVGWFERRWIEPHMDKEITIEP